MAIAVKHAIERGPIEPALRIVPRIRRNHGPVIHISRQVNIRHELEVLVIVVRFGSESVQVFSRVDQVRVVGLARPARRT